MLEAPLVLPDDAALQLQVTVGAADAEGRREVAIYSRAETADEDGERAATCHASGVFAEAGGTAAPFPAEWPPVGAEQVEVAGLYDRLADAGYEYGPVFQGLRAAWRDGATVFAEVALPEGAGERGFRCASGVAGRGAAWRHAGSGGWLPGGAAVLLVRGAARQW